MGSLTSDGTGAYGAEERERGNSNRDPSPGRDRNGEGAWGGVRESGIEEDVGSSLQRQKRGEEALPLSCANRRGKGRIG